jgi:hypothetical protein
VNPTKYLVFLFPVVEESFGIPNRGLYPFVVFAPIPISALVALEHAGPVESVTHVTRFQ